MDAAAFSLLALALSLRSGYSIGAVLLLLLGLCCWPAVLAGRIRWSPALAAWALTVAVMGGVWSMHIIDAEGQLITHSLGLDRCIKYLLIILALPAFLAQRPRAAVLAWACVLGAASAGLTALWEVLVQQQDRADGYTNAIQFGNLALLLGLWSGLWALQGSTWPLRAAGWMGALLGVVASLASGSRGGWITLPVLLLLALWLGHSARHAGATRQGLRATAVTTLVCLVVVALPPVQERVQLATDEFVRQEQQFDNSSIGLRMAFWNLAWTQGKAHPLIGIGQAEYERRQREAVERQEMPAQAVMFNHAHNEWLDMFAKRGLVGVLGLLLFYAVPGVLFWRALRRIQPDHPDTHARRAAALCGLTTVLGFLGFGMTQVMFAHNNGNLMYLLAVSLWLAVCWHGPRPAPASSVAMAA